MTRRCLVSGGAGFIGSHLVDELIGRGRAVTVLDDFSSGSSANLAEAIGLGDVRIVRGSILDRDAIEAALEGCDRIYHLAVQCVRRSIGRPLENHHVNATGTLNLLEAARRHQVKRFLYCSSSEVYGNCGDERLGEATSVCAPVTVYGAAKFAGEHYTNAYGQTYGLPVIIVRPFNSYGPRAHCRGDLAEVVARFVIRVLNGLPPVIFGTGGNGRDFTYVTETARGIADAGEREDLRGQVVNLAYGKMITVREVAKVVAEICGTPDLAPRFGEPRPGDVMTLQADTSRARDLLGFVAEIPFREGVRKYIEWFREAHPNPAQLLDSTIQNWEMPAL